MAAPAAAPRTGALAHSCALIVFHPKTGTTRCVQTDLDYCGDTVSMVFKTATEPVVQWLLKSGVWPTLIDPTQASHCTEVRQVTFGTRRHSESPNSLPVAEKIKRAIVNLHLPIPRHRAGNPCTAEGMDWNVTIPYVGDMCRGMFPNIDPQESCFNVHYELESFRVNDQFRLMDDQNREITLTRRSAL